MEDQTYNAPNEDLLSDDIEETESDDNQSFTLTENDLFGIVAY